MANTDLTGEAVRLLDGRDRLGGTSELREAHREGLRRLRVHEGRVHADGHLDGAPEQRLRLHPSSSTPQVPTEPMQRVGELLPFPERLEHRDRDPTFPLALLVARL